MKIACLGLSANPPHCMHLAIAREILKNNLADKVWFIPCWKHSFGKELAEWKYRWDMLKLMEEPGIKCSDIEFRRKGISYTIDTIRTLKKMHPEHEFVWVIGSDIVKDESYRKWAQWKKLTNEIKFWVAQRQGFEINAFSIPSCFVLLDIKTLNISSTIIRERLRKGLSINGLVTPKVEKYISEKKLYRN